MDVKKEKQLGVGTQGPMKKEHSQQQADKYEVLLKVVKSVTATQCDRAAAGADVPQGAKTDPQSENVDEKGSGEF